MNDTYIDVADLNVDKYEVNKNKNKNKNENEDDDEHVQMKIWMKRALNLLARREHSYIELVNKLIAKTCPAEIAELVVSECLSKNYLNLNRFAQMYAKNKASSGYGPNKIRLELINLHNISTDDITTVFDEINWDDAQNVAKRKIKHEDPIKQRQALYLRGF